MTVRTVEAFSSDEGCLGLLMSALCRVVHYWDVLASAVSVALPYAMAWHRYDVHTCYAAAEAIGAAVDQLPENVKRLVRWWPQPLLMMRA
jgi:hypothetical protein